MKTIEIQLYLKQLQTNHSRFDMCILVSHVVIMILMFWITHP
jgi:hypothetical protein